MSAESEDRQTLSCVPLYPFMGNFLSRVCLPCLRSLPIKTCPQNRFWFYSSYQQLHNKPPQDVEASNSKQSVTVTGGQEFWDNLVECLWLRVPHEAAIKQLAMAAVISGSPEAEESAPKPTHLALPGLSFLLHGLLHRLPEHPHNIAFGGPRAESQRLTKSETMVLW